MQRQTGSVCCSKGMHKAVSTNYLFPPSLILTATIAYYILQNHSINFCLAELSKCVNLKKLDLSFVVGHAVNMSLFLNIITKLTKLECLHAPGSHDRLFMSLARPNLWQWPPNLRELHISGSLVHCLLTSFTPESLPCLTRLYVLNWPHLTHDINFLNILLPLLEFVDIKERM